MYFKNVILGFNYEVLSFCIHFKMINDFYLKSFSYGWIHFNISHNLINYLFWCTFVFSLLLNFHSVICCSMSFRDVFDVISVLSCFIIWKFKLWNLGGQFGCLRKEGFCYLLLEWVLSCIFTFVVSLTSSRSILVFVLT